MNWMRTIVADLPCRTLPNRLLLVRKSLSTSLHEIVGTAHNRRRSHDGSISSIPSTAPEVERGVYDQLKRQEIRILRKAGLRLRDVARRERVTLDFVERFLAAPPEASVPHRPPG